MRLEGRCSSSNDSISLNGSDLNSHISRIEELGDIVTASTGLRIEAKAYKQERQNQEANHFP